MDNDKEMATESRMSLGADKMGSVHTTSSTEAAENHAGGAGSDSGGEEGQPEPDRQQSVGVVELNYDDMEMEFEEVLQELSADTSLEKFQAEYRKLHSALQRSHQNERSLMDKYRELQAEIAAHSAEMATALKLAAEDKQAIEALKREVEKAWKMVDLAHDREQEAKDTMESLQAEIAHMHQLAGQTEQISSEQQETMDELSATKADLTRERTDLLAEVTRLRSQLDRAMACQEDTEKRRLETEARLQNLTEEMQVLRSDFQRETRRKDRAERDLKAAKADIEGKQADVKKIQAQMDQLNEQMDKTNLVVKEQKLMNENVMKEAEQMAEQQQRLQQDYEAALLSIDQLTQYNRQTGQELKEKEEETARLNQETLDLTRLRDSLTRKLRSAEQQREEAEQEREGTVMKVRRLERELDVMKRAMEAEKRIMDGLRHERELLKKSVLKTQAEYKLQENTLKVHDQAKKRLEHEGDQLRQAILKQRFIVAQMQREREKCIMDSAGLAEKNIRITGLIKLKEQEIFELKKRVAESESRLKQQQSLYEAVRSDRNLYSKNLIESQNEVTEMNRKFKMVVHQINQLKEETAARETLLLKDQTELLRVRKDKEALLVDLEEQRVTVASLKARITAMEMEHQKLVKVLADGEVERNKQRKDMNQIMTERDILGTQLVRRNDELALLYEKIRIQQSTLSKGEQQYRDRINDIRLLKLEIKKLRREKSLLSRSVHNLEDMRREMYHMHRALLKERSMCKALEDELQNPQNVHRWRKLEGTDPGTYEMVLKIQTLQRRLIAKTQDATKKELEIQEKQRLYLELKQVLARQPGPETAEKLLLCQDTLRQRTRQMKSLVSELNMYESQIQEYKRDVDRLTGQLAEFKKLFINQKKQQRSRLRSGVPVGAEALRPPTRFPAIGSPATTGRNQPPLGGGFKLPSLAANT
ncbi:cilia- and flagella-associated protein 58-like [Amphibalanus amphitrite]|uniref:cilia- and flagella-associated protein 58-like n=1 Tax=Amphibalanus amphitrite TaxID=1232801 RepID=UPI001C9167B8|nr:cilia- and flagella-associated protein 58-like [Amphibalanus amphitrite]